MMSGLSVLQRVRSGLIGRDAVRDGPFGPRPLTYADYTASGRAVDLVEDAVRREVLPWYANTHTESSATGRRTTALREQARQAVCAGVGGDESTAVIFCGSGATGAIDRLIALLGLRIPSGLARFQEVAPPPPGRRPVVFVGPYEHHSNEIAWRETIADVVVIPLDDAGGVCTATLEAELARYAFRPLRIGSFSAASNVTGVLTDTSRISRILHAHGALALWDYAAAAPYVDIAMTTRRGQDPLDYKDAVFLSPHKMVGGPGSPGVLAVRRDLLRNSVPAVPGGGTVRFVAPWAHDYLDDVEHREEGGTPDIVGSIRAGLAFRLKAAVGQELITALEERNLSRARTVWGNHPAIDVLGPADAPRLPILSFRVRSPGGGYLHHNLVVALLDDLFGIQARGGCSCAGPYGHRLLGIDRAASAALERTLDAGQADGVRPGWARVSLPYVLADEEVDYVLRAVVLVAEHGWRLLPQYRFSPPTGLWRHVGAPHDDAPDLTSLLLDVAATDPWPDAERRIVVVPRPRGLAGGLDPHGSEDDGRDLQVRGPDRYLDEAERLVAALPAAAPDETSGTDGARVSDGFDALRWFDLPAVCLADPSADPAADPAGRPAPGAPRSIRLPAQALPPGAMQSGIRPVPRSEE